MNYESFFAELKRRNVYKVGIAYAVVGWLKRREGVDVYDVGTDFTPFTLDR